VAAPHLSAHHSFAMFDTARRVTLVGTVTGSGPPSVKVAPPSSE
jgi:hypothetical protein